MTLTSPGMGQIKGARSVRVCRDGHRISCVTLSPKSARSQVLMKHPRNLTERLTVKEGLRDYFKLKGPEKYTNEMQSVDVDGILWLERKLHERSLRLKDGTHHCRFIIQVAL